MPHSSTGVIVVIALLGWLKINGTKKQNLQTHIFYWSSFIR